ncbi:hypothetical protein ACKXGF_05740 [Alkalibacillus sp. S2W]|uniref:hypothetical protein n=1 Tax=Alkalibacillus sp. S2W TaxID=3386553 RepID=UPI00398D647E
MFERLKPTSQYGRIGLYTFIIGAILFVVIESIFTLWLNQYQLVSLIFWFIGMIGALVYITDLIKHREGKDE